MYCCSHLRLYHIPILISVYIDVESPLTRSSWDLHDQDIFSQEDLVRGHPKHISTVICFGQRYHIKWPQQYKNLSLKPNAKK